MSFLEELKRRNVLRVAFAYLAGSWLVIQIADTVLPRVGFSDTAVTNVIIVLAIGFIPALILAWVFELTPEGIKRGSEVVRTSPVATRTFDRIVIVTLAAGLAYFAVDKFVFEPARNVEQIAEAREEGRTEALVRAYGDKSIAVLPFLNLSSDPEQAYFSDGVTEELLNLLARIRELRVISRTSAFSYKGKDIDVPTVAKELDVAHVLEGSVRKSGDRIRITVQLIDARSDTHLWSETYDRTLDDVFAIQDDIAAEIVSRLKIELLGAAPTTKKVNSQAYALMLKARRILDNYEGADHRIEVENLIKKALELEPDYNDALGELARVYYRGGGIEQLGHEEGLRRAREVVSRMQAIDPDDGNADAFLAWFAFFEDFDFVIGAYHLQRALMARPTDVDYLRDSMYQLSLLGYLDEAVTVGEYVVANDPLCTRCHYLLARAYRLAGYLDEAEAAIRAALILVDPYQYPLQRDLGRVLLLKGDAQAALEAFEKADDLPGMAMALHDLGRRQEFEAAFSELHERFDSESPSELANVYAWIGDKDAAIERLFREFDIDRASLSRIVRYPVFKSLHDDPRWDELLRKLGMHPEQLAAIDFKLPPIPRVH